MLGSGNVDTAPEVPMFKKPAQRPRRSTPVCTSGSTNGKPEDPQALCSHPGEDNLVVNAPVETDTVSEI